MKTINKFLFLTLLLIAGIANAEQSADIGIEVLTLKIKLSNDGTGIVKNMGCYKQCEDFSIVKITRKTKSYIDGVEVNGIEAKSRAKEAVYIEFNPATRVVTAIYW